MSKLKPPPKPPKIDLEPFRKAVNEAAGRVRGLWFTYIALLAYLFIAVGAVTHRDLLLEKPVKLPILNVELPLVGFFAVAPIFFLINHFYFLLQLLGLGRRIRKFNDEIAKTGLGEDAQLHERYKLDTFIIVQMLAGANEERKQLTGVFFKAIALITVVIAPVALLLFIQLQFLPYQFQAVTWLHRIALGIDLAMLWAFWPSIRQGNWTPWRSAPVRATARALAATVIMLFACVVATFPGEFADGGTKAKNWSKAEHSYLPVLKRSLFGELPYVHIGEAVILAGGLTPFTRALVLLDDKTLIDLDKFDKIRRRHRDNKDQLRPWETGRTLSLRERNLRGAKFDRSYLRNVDLYNAKLQGASLEFAELQGASLMKASLQDASLEGAKLQGASLYLAKLQDASLEYAKLQDASLEFAELQSAWLSYAWLQGASLKSAKLQSATLARAYLKGASLEVAKLQGARLENAELQGASLKYANLQCASLEKAQLQGASLEKANLQGASLEKANLQDATLNDTYLWRAHGKPDPGDPVRVWVGKPKLQALTSIQFARFEKYALSGVKSDYFKRSIKRQFARRLLPAKDVRDKLPQSYWTDLIGKVSEENHQKDLAKRLVALACDDKYAPYVAQGLIRSSRLKAVGDSYLPNAAKTLLDAAEGRTADCSGVKGLDTKSIAQLRKWAAKPESKSKQTAK